MIVSAESLYLVPLDSFVVFTYCQRCKKPVEKSNLIQCAICINTVYCSKVCAALHLKSHFFEDSLECENIFARRKYDILQSFKSELYGLFNEHWLENNLFSFYYSEGNWVERAKEFAATHPTIEIDLGDDISISICNTLLKSSKPLNQNNTPV